MVSLLFFFKYSAVIFIFNYTRCGGGSILTVLWPSGATFLGSEVYGSHKMHNAWCESTDQTLRRGSITTPDDSHL